jgi:hypothetical protein
MSRESGRLELLLEISAKDWERFCPAKYAFVMSICTFTFTLLFSCIPHVISYLHCQ